LLAAKPAPEKIHLAFSGDNLNNASIDNGIPGQAILQYWSS
jgi:hypothetical protein